MAESLQPPSPRRARSEITSLPPLSFGDNIDLAPPAQTRDDDPSSQTVPNPNDNPGSYHLKVNYRFLTPQEWALVAHGVGGISDHEGHRPVHATCSYWGPKGMPPGLYKDVVYQRTKYSYCYHTLSTLRWVGMMMQLFVGAALTALGALSLKDGTPITILAAANTVTAGLLGLLHNSGIPERYRSDQMEFEAVEDYIKEVLDSGLVEEGRSAGHVLAECFERYQGAKHTIQANLPANYTPNSGLNKPGDDKTPAAAQGDGGPAAAPGVCEIQLGAGPAAETVLQESSFAGTRSAPLETEKQ